MADYRLVLQSPAAGVSRQDKVRPQAWKRVNWRPFADETRGCRWQDVRVAYYAIPKRVMVQQRQTTLSATLTNLHADVQAVRSHCQCTSHRAHRASPATHVVAVCFLTTCLPQLLTRQPLSEIFGPALDILGSGFC